MPRNWMRTLALAGVVSYLALPISSVISQNASANPTSASPSEYRLGPQDKISIKVYEWRPSRDEIYEWSAFKAEHTVDSSGFLSLPLAGKVAAAGFTTTVLARDIGDRLRRRMGLVENPDITVELIQFRPFYVVGAVEKPGEFPYRPGLTVLKAYAIAGGKPRSALGLVRLEREAIATRGDLDAFDLEGQTLLIRLARLQAELRNAEAVEWPAELRERIEIGPLNRVAQQEQLVFDTRKEAFHTQLGAIEQLATYLDEEVRYLEQQVDVHRVETDSVKTESDMIASLHKRGLAVTSRKLALERNVAQVDGDRLRLESSLMRARQEVSKTKIAIIDLRAKRSSDISSEMQKAQTRLEELRARADTARSLLFETENVAPQLIASEEKAQDVSPSFKIVRAGKTLPADEVAESTGIEPGDTLVVEAPTRRSMSKDRNLGEAAATSASASNNNIERLR